MTGDCGAEAVVALPCGPGRLQLSQHSLQCSRDALRHMTLQHLAVRIELFGSSDCPSSSVEPVAVVYTTSAYLLLPSNTG